MEKLKNDLVKEKKDIENRTECMKAIDNLDKFKKFINGMQLLIDLSQKIQDEKLQIIYIKFMYIRFFDHVICKNIDYLNEWIDRFNAKTNIKYGDYLSKSVLNELMNTNELL